MTMVEVPQLWTPRRRRAPRVECAPTGLGLGFNKHPRFDGGAAFTPTSISGCVLWLRADLGVTIGTGVSAWADQSGTGDSNKNCTQATGSNQPTRNSSDTAYNNQTTLSFASASSQFLQSGTWSTAPPTSAATIFVVGNTDGTGARQAFTDGLSAATYGLWNNDNGSETNTVAFFLSAYLIKTGASLGSPSAVAVTCIAGSSSSAIFANAKTALGTGSPGTSSPTGLTLGAFAGGGSYLNGKIAEVIIYNSDIGSSNRSLVWNYLGSRYGISIGS